MTGAAAAVTGGVRSPLLVTTITAYFAAVMMAGDRKPTRLLLVATGLAAGGRRRGGERRPAHPARADGGDVRALCRGSTLRDTGRARGLGLGLYIVRQIVGAHGGTIAVDSSAERGTTFTVRLPRLGASRAAGAGRTWEGDVAAGA